MIDAFNADIPYDRFLHEQLAGDILAADGPPDDYARRVIATGFLAQAKRFGTRKLEDIHQIIEDTLNTTGQVVLGLSLRCARCHDHKYDPITARDYYALYGFFAGTKYPFAGAEEDRRPSEFAPLVPPDRIKDFEAKHAETLAQLKAELARPRPAARPLESVRDLGLAAAEAEFLAAVAGPSDRAAAAAALEAAKVELAKADADTRRPAPAAPRRDQAARGGRAAGHGPAGLRRPRRRADRREAPDRRRPAQARRASCPRGVPKVPRARRHDRPARDGQRPARARPLAHRGPAART